MTSTALSSYWDSLILFAGDWGARLLAAALVAIVAYVVARLVKWALSRAVDKLPISRTSEKAEGAPTLGARIGDAGFWLVLLFALPQALHALRLDAIVAPLDLMIGRLFAFQPNLVGAILIFAIGMLAANIARRATVATLSAADLGKWTAKLGMSGAGDIPGVAGHIVYALVVIPVAIAALEALRIEAISGPAVEILRAALDAVPRLIGAAILMALTFAVGRFVANLAEDLLPQLGFDDLVGRLGLGSGGATPSKLAANALLIVIILFGAVEATRLLNFAAVSAIFATVLELAGRIAFGAAIILAGALIARTLGDLVARTAGDRGGLAAPLTRGATLALSIAMGLRFMGLAPEIVTLAFGLILGSIAVAAALAFGLGGRAGAARLVDEWADEIASPGRSADKQT